MRGLNLSDQWTLLSNASRSYVTTSYLPLLSALVTFALVACSEQERNESIKTEPDQVAHSEGLIFPRSVKPQLNDTGITWGGNYPKGINDDCSAKIDTSALPEGKSPSGDIISAQDCMSGQDVTAARGTDSLNKKPAFHYEKVGVQGALLVNDAPVWFCVLDKNTDLMWEVKQPGDQQFANRGLHDSDDIFMWYSGDPKNNGGSVGKWNAHFANCTGFVEGQPATYCNTSEFVRRINQQTLCGYDDWRLPTLPELNGLIHYGQTQPAIDGEFFPNTQHQYYWTSTPSAGNADLAWAVNFQFGNTSPLRRDNARPIRVVRSAHASTK